MNSVGGPAETGVEVRAREVSTKVTALRAMMRGEGLAGMVLRSQASVAWLGAGLSNRALRDRQESLVWILVTEDALHLLTWDTEKVRLESEEDILELGVRPHYTPWTMQNLDLVLHDLVPVGSVGADGPGDAIDCSHRLRSRLMEDEARRLVVLSEEVTSHLEDALRAARPGLRERELAGQLAGDLETIGALPLVLLVGSGERLDSFRHWTPTDLPIVRAVTVTVAVERRGLVTVVCRTAWFDHDAARRRSQSDVMRVAAAAAVGTRVGSSWGAALEEAAHEYEACGYPDEWQRHFQGGAVGYDTREFSPGPSREPNSWSSLLVTAGQAVAWNPTLPGVKSEDTYLVATGGRRLLTRTDAWPTVLMDHGGCPVEVPDVLVA